MCVSECVRSEHETESAIPPGQIAPRSHAAKSTRPRRPATTRHLTTPPRVPYFAEDMLADDKADAVLPDRLREANVAQVVVPAELALLGVHVKHEQPLKVSHSITVKMK